MARALLVLNGPNLNLLSQREPDTYGHEKLPDLEARWRQHGADLGFDVNCLQSNHEGVLVDALQEAGAAGTPIVFNPGAYSHTSIALRDAIVGAQAHVIEVHISNVHARERFRHFSYVSAVAIGVIAGLGTIGYELAINAHHTYLTRTQ
ncbi:MAG: type II 3-dehydroquinate dehydratase [Pseudomonadota bacterium]